MWSYMSSYIKWSSKMQLRWKNIFQAIREAESCFPDKLVCFRFDLIFVFKLLTEALLDPETNQLVLINAVLFWFGCCYHQDTLGWTEQHPSHPWKIWEQKCEFEAHGQDKMGSNSPWTCSVSSKSVISGYIWDIENYFQVSIDQGKVWISWALSLLLSSATTHPSPWTQESSLAKVNLP